MITEVRQEGRFYRPGTGRAARFENNKSHNPPPQKTGVYLKTWRGQ